MKKILVTYDTVDVDGIQGETCCELVVSDVWSDSLFDEDIKESTVKLVREDYIREMGTAYSMAILLVEGALSSLETLKSRSYVYGSIKDIRLIF